MHLWSPHWLSDSQRRREGMTENKRAACRQHLVIYSVCSAQFFLFPTFSWHYKKKRGGCLSAKNLALHTKEWEPHRKPQKPRSHLPSAVRCGEWVWRIGHLYVLLHQSLFPRLLEIHLHTGQAAAIPCAAWRIWKAEFSTGARCLGSNPSEHTLEFSFSVRIFVSLGAWWRTAWGIWISYIYFPCFKDARHFLFSE